MLINFKFKDNDESVTVSIIMPEISQDNFELLNRFDLPATQQVRARANSTSGADRSTSAVINTNVINNNANRMSRSITSTTAEEIAQTQSSTRQLRLMSETSTSGAESETPTNTFVGFQNDYIFGYKREMTHR